MISYFLNTMLFYKDQVSEELIEFNENRVGWKFNIAVGSAANIIWGFSALLICYVFNLHFKIFVFIMLTIPILRIVLGILEIKFAKKAVQKLLQILRK